MKRRKNRRVESVKKIALLFFFLQFIAPAPDLSALEMLPVPNWLEARQVADRMVINGLPSRVYYFTTQHSPEAVVDYYRQHWQQAGEKKFKEQCFAHWHIISALQDKMLYTVQARQTGEGSSGYLAVSDLKAIRKNNRSAIPSMRGSKVVNDTMSYDPGQKGRTVQLQNSFSVLSNTSFYQQHYGGLGWTVEVYESSGDSAVLVFRKRGKAVHIVITRGGGMTSIVYQLVTHTG